MTSREDWQLDWTRRELLGRTAAGIGSAALSSLLAGTAAYAAPSEASPLASAHHMPPRAKRVIYLFQNGAPTHVDLFDYKPKLGELHGQPLPASYAQGKRFSTMTGDAQGKLILAPVEPFRQRGESGAWVSDFLPHIATVSDELCYVKGLHTDAINHAPAISFLLSGSQLPGRPTMGAWLNYGLGHESENLPAFVVMTSVSKGTTCGQIFYDFYWGSGFLPSQHQGVRFRAGGDPVLNVFNPPGIDRPMRQAWLQDLARINQLHWSEFHDPEIATRTAQYEMAFRMQASVPELTDISDESAATLAMYGPQVHEPGSYARHCLLARRLVEKGVRFVQVMHAGWDQHNSITTELYTQCRDTDQPSAALIRDLRQRGLLEDTLVIWGGEFGRTPFIQGDFSNRPKWGRDHHPYGFTVWMAGGGVRPGLSYGGTDELGFNAVEHPVHVHDFQATLLHLLGIDHERLTYRFQGRQFRLTDVHGKVVTDLLA